MNRIQITAALLLSAVASSICLAADRSSADAQQVLDQSAAEQKHAFLLFYKEDNQATRAMVQTLKAGIAKRADRANLALVRVSDPAAQELVKQFGTSRAPLPLTLAVAPNGAVTGVHSQKLADANIEGSISTTAMATCMKAMQNKKLVLVFVHTSGRNTTPAGVTDFQNDPEFSERVTVISVDADDASEAKFLQQMEINPTTVKTSSIVFLAPPAVLVGKFASTATKAEMAAALHKAGKCCDDPNCKHNHGPQATKAASGARK